MPDIKQEAVEAAKTVDLEAQRAKQAALSKLNQTESWVSSHPAITLVAAAAVVAILLGIIIALT